MKQKTIILAIMMLCASLPSTAQMLLNYSTRTTVPSTTVPMPQRDVVTLEDGSIRVTYTFTGALLKPDDVYPGRYWWTIGGFGFTETSSSPALPVRIDVFPVPAGKIPTLKNITYLNNPFFRYGLAPGRVPLDENDTEGYTQSNVKPLLGSNTQVPVKNVYIHSMDSYRGENIVRVAVFPIKYQDGTTDVLTFKQISYTVSFEDDDSESPVLMVDGSDIERARDDYFPYHFLLAPPSGGSYPTVGGDSGSGESGSGGTKWNLAKEVKKSYLVLTTDRLISSTTDFVTWKRKQGFNVIVESAPEWTYKTAKAKVDQVFTENPDLYHLLIVGGHEDVPGRLIASRISGLGTHYTDYYYSYKGSSLEKMPDISVGRIPFTDLLECENVLKKICRYEKGGFSVDDQAKFTSIAYFEDRDKDGYEDKRFALTGNEIYDYATVIHRLDGERIFKAESDVNPNYWNKTKFADGTVIPTALRKPTFAWNGSATDIQNSINGGCSILTYRGHGLVNQWESLKYYTSNIRALENSQLPMVLSICCLTGKYDASDCFASTFLSSEKNGCVGVIASSEKAYPGYTDSFVEGMIDAIWPSPGLVPRFGVSVGTPSVTPIGLRAIGDIMNQGFMRMSETYGVVSADYKTLTKEEFHLFGDPSMTLNFQKKAWARNIITKIERTPISDERDDTLLGTPLQSSSITVSLERSAYIGLYNTVTKESKMYYGQMLWYLSDDDPDNWAVTIYDYDLVPYLELKYEIGAEIIGPILPINPTIAKISSSTTTCNVMLDDMDEISAQPELEVRNTYGAVVSRTQCEEGVSDYSIDISGLNSGIYVVSLSLEGNIL